MSEALVNTEKLPQNGEGVNGIVLKVRGVEKSYGALQVLKDIHLEVRTGERCAIVGPSGSGKTTLLGLCAGLDWVDRGEIWVDGERLNALDEDGRADLRNRCVGFVFQSFQLIPTLTAEENVMIPLELSGGKKMREMALDILERVGLGDRVRHYPAQLSGGEQQRVALARAFVHRPKILFADEPTGNLDAETGAKIEEILFQLNEEHGTTLILVTHDSTLADQCGKTVKMGGGRILEVNG